MRKYMLLILLALVAWSCQSFDLLVEKNEIAAEKWSNYEAQLQRRSDLVPNLVAVVEARAKHEHDTLKDVAEARAGATQIKLTADDLTDPAKVAAFEAAQNKLKGSLSRLMMVQEQYPDLKADQGFHSLQVQIEATENRILRSREEYNKFARDYNVELQKIHGRVTNSATGHEFKPRVYFTAEPAALTAPKVTFGK